MSSSSALSRQAGLVFLLAVVAGLVCAPGILKAQPVAMTAGHTLATDHPYHLGLVYFGELLKERTNGEVTLEVYHSSQLGSERDLIEGLQMGSVSMAAVTTASLSAFTNEFLVYDLPFLFPDTETARRVLDGELGAGSLRSLEAIDIVGLTYFENGFRHLTNSARPVVEPGDARGLKIRTMQNEIHMAAFQAVGAVPAQLSFGELFSALQQGLMDGQENPVPIIYTSKFYQVQKYCSLTGHFYSPTPVLIRRQIWDAFSDERKAIVRQAASEARDYQRKLNDEQNARCIDKLKEEGMEVVEVDKAVWLAAMQPVYDQFADKIGPEVIRRVQEEILNPSEPSDVPPAGAPEAETPAGDDPAVP
ncbi:MAG: TRAP transporter substrate-binding protein [Deltaproteobacteria bacterium]|jgi:tripartite ATP-independent transporter DctP family solute receptor|nr:TRAP transporter substrate-binding protein [Deltaproteobacteria bacterium]